MPGLGAKTVWLQVLGSHRRAVGRRAGPMSKHPQQSCPVLLMGDRRDSTSVCVHNDPGDKKITGHQKDTELRQTQSLPAWSL